MRRSNVLREFLLRGGFLMLDDFWGPEEYARFDETMKKVFPDRPVVEMPNEDAIFHTVYDLDDRYQILGQWALERLQPSVSASAPRHQGALAGSLRRQRPRHGGDVVQLRYRRFLGVGGRARTIRRSISASGHPHRSELRRLRHDALEGRSALCDSRISGRAYPRTELIVKNHLPGHGFISAAGWNKLPSPR